MCAVRPHKMAAGRGRVLVSPLRLRHDAEGDGMFWMYWVMVFRSCVISVRTSFFSYLGVPYYRFLVLLFKVISERDGTKW